MFERFVISSEFCEQIPGADSPLESGERGGDHIESDRCICRYWGRNSQKGNTSDDDIGWQGGAIW